MNKMKKEKAEDIFAKIAKDAGINEDWLTKRENIKYQERSDKKINTLIELYPYL